MDGIYEVVIGGHDGAGNYAENVLHFVVQGTSGSVLAYQTAHDLLSVVGTAVLPPLSACMGTDCVIDVFSARRVDGPGGPTYDIPTNVAGSGTSESYSQAASIDVAMYPGGARNKVGHMYLWGVELAAILSGAIQSAFLAVLSSLFTALLTSFTVETGTALLATYTKATNVATFVSTLVNRSKVSGFSKRTAPVS